MNSRLYIVTREFPLSIRHVNGTYYTDYVSKFHIQGIFFIRTWHEYNNAIKSKTVKKTSFFFLSVKSQAYRD